MAEHGPPAPWAAQSIRVLIGSREVLDEAPDEEWARSTAADMDPDRTAAFLAALNRDYEQGAQDGESQKMLAKAVLRDQELQGQLLDALDEHGSGRPGEWLWYAPQVGLYGVRLLAETMPRATLRESEAVQRDLFFRWILHLAGIVAERVAGPESCNDTWSWIAWELANWQAHGTDYVQGVFARTGWFLFADREPVVAESPNFIDIEGELCSILGISPLAYLAVLFMVYSRLISPREPAIHLKLDWPAWAETNLSQKQVEGSLDRAARDLPRLAQRYEETRYLAGRGPFNILPFAETPLVRLPSGSYICPWVRLLVRHVRDGLYHELWNKYRNDEGRPDNRFTRFWGELTESYVAALFDELLVSRGPLKRLWFGPDLTYGTPQREAVDLIAEGANELLFVEVTSTNLTLQSMCLRRADAVRRDLHNTIISKAAQLDRCISDFRDRRIAFREAEPNPKRTIVPVIITPGFTPSFPPSQRHISGEISARQLLGQQGVLPLQVYSLGDLEALMNYGCSGDGIASLVGAKARSEGQHVESSFADWVIREGLRDPQDGHPLIHRTFERLFSDMEELLFP